MGHSTTRHQPGDQMCPFSIQLYLSIILILGALRSVVRVGGTCSVTYFTLAVDTYS